jgi:hypothetical protein
MVIDRITQGWQRNRFGCTISKIREFKELEEQVRLIHLGQPFNRRNPTSEIKKIHKGDNDYLTVMEAKTECLRIQTFYREQTPEIKEDRIKEELLLSLKRKYSSDFKYAIKFVMEQISI